MQMQVPVLVLLCGRSRGGERWEIEKAEGEEKRTGMTFLYNHRRKRFDLCDGLGAGEVVGDEALYERIEETGKYLIQIAA